MRATLCSWILSASHLFRDGMHVNKVSEDGDSSSGEGESKKTFEGLRLILCYLSVQVKEE